MDKLIKKILTDRKIRNTAAISAFILTIAAAGEPWAV